MKNYYWLRRKYDSEIIIIKKGVFYYTYLEDAYIINYIFNYKIIKKEIDCVGFSDLIKITMLLDELNIGYLISDDKEVKRTLGDSNNYNQYIGLALDNLGKKVLINKINKLLYWLDISKLEELVLTLN